MTGAELMTLQRDLTGTDSTNYADAKVLIDLNISYHLLEETVSKIAGEKFFWDRLDSTMVSGQSEYTFYSATSGNLKGTKKTYWVSIDFGGTGDFVKCTRIDTDLLDYDSSYYEGNQSQEDPYYEIKDGSLFVYPAPTDWVSVIRHSATHNLIDLTASTAEVDVFNGKLPLSCHYAIVMGARKFWFLRRQNAQKAAEAEAEFENVELPKVLRYVNTRDVSAKKRRTAPWFDVNPL